MQIYKCSIAAVYNIAMTSLNLGLRERGSREKKQMKVVLSSQHITIHEVCGMVLKLAIDLEVFVREEYVYSKRLKAHG